MNRQPGTASLWRIDLATELAKHYSAREEAKMIVLGGSPSKGLSDSYSDLDVVVYWDSIPLSWLEEIPLGSLNCRRELFKKMGEEDIYLESYYFQNLKVDFGHVTMTVWEELTRDVIERYDADPDKHGTIGGFLGAVPLHGQSLFGEWAERLSNWPDELARNVVKTYLRFYHRGVLLHQGLERGDLVFFYDGICRMLQNILGTLAGLNRTYYSPAEPRWVEYHLARMPLKPENAWPRIVSIFDAKRSEAASILEGLIDDVFDLVVKHMPEVDVTLSRHRYNLVVKPTDSKPVVTGQTS